MEQVASTGMWIGFSFFLVIALGLDTFLVGKYGARSHESIRVALFWTALWIVCALLFNGVLWCYLYASTSLVNANTRALEFFTGYIIEKSLSVDNLFAFYMVFEQFRVPVMYQQRVFAYGIWGAIIMRLGIILLGTWLVAQFHWLLYIMGIFLLLTGIKMIYSKEKEKDLAETMVIRLAKRFFRVTPDFHQERFFIRKNYLLYATPLFLALIFIEFSDLVFAFDSIPAIFAITQDPFIVWTSNIFAILGLRAMYFLLARMINRFRLLKYGIALILIFVGVEMVIEPWLVIPVGVSLLIIAMIITLFSILSAASDSRQRVN